jgi:hypothetical protein
MAKCCEGACFILLLPFVFQFISGFTFRPAYRLALFFKVFLRSTIFLKVFLRLAYPSTLRLADQFVFNFLKANLRHTFQFTMPADASGKQSNLI